MITHAQLAGAERHVYAQNGEDGVIEAIFREIGPSTRVSVEIGASFDGRECNTRLLAEQGWQALRLDADARPGSGVTWAFVCAENAVQVFREQRVPVEFDLLSIDVDGIDFWVWNALGNYYRPRVVIVEYNANMRAPVTVPYRPFFIWDKTRYYGASVAALEWLARRMGYVLVYCESQGVNAFFVRDDLAAHFERRSVDDLYRPPAYNLGAGHPPDPHNREWFDVTLQRPVECR